MLRSNTAMNLLHGGPSRRRDPGTETSNASWRFAYDPWTCTGESFDIADRIARRQHRVLRGGMNSKPDIGRPMRDKSLTGAQSSCQFPVPEINSGQSVRNSNDQQALALSRLRPLNLGGNHVRSPE